MKKAPTLALLSNGASWESSSAAPNAHLAHLYCARRSCHSKATWPVEHGPAGLRPWAYEGPEKLAAYEEADRLARDEYNALELPIGWVVMTWFAIDDYNDSWNTRAFCSARCARLASAAIEQDKRP